MSPIYHILRESCAVSVQSCPSARGELTSESIHASFVRIGLYIVAEKATKSLLEAFNSACEVCAQKRVLARGAQLQPSFLGRAEAHRREMI